MKKNYKQFFKNLHIDAEVYWCDPAGQTSGVYKVKNLGEFIGKETIILIATKYSEAEVYLSELS